MPQLGLAVFIVAALALALPRIGILAQLRLARKARVRERVEDGLKLLLDKKQAGIRVSAETLNGHLRLSPGAGLRLRTRMESRGLIRSEGDSVVLTPEGQRLALQILRAHRLWERYLATEARMPLRRVHRYAHRLEHSSDAAQLAAMEASLGYPGHDPHGDPIPTSDGNLRPEPDAIPMTSLAVGATGRIAHLEDEPPLAFAQILAEGLRLGQTLTVLEATPDRYVLAAGDNEVRLAPAVAANIYVVATTAQEGDRSTTTLASLREGQEADVVDIDETCQGFTRRRFLDLGLTPGTAVRPELSNAFGDPRAYRIRGTLIALRKDQASLIRVKARS